MKYIRDVETKSVSLRLRKPYTGADLSAHTILTDDVFSYVDFYFKTHKKIIKDSNGKKVDQNHLFYWNQAKNFYNASKVLNVESAPLPMYYCMLNAMKAYLVYNAKTYDIVKNDFRGHGLKESNNDSEGNAYSLSEIYVQHLEWGVFVKFANLLTSNSFNSLWKSRETGAISVKDLLYYIPFVHGAYVSTYKLPRNKERFIPLKAGHSPTFRYPKKGKIHLVAELDKGYFKQDAVTVPDYIKNTIPYDFEVNPDNGFEIMSKDEFLKKDIKSQYLNYRKSFSYIRGEKRMWYLNRFTDKCCIGNLNTMIFEVAITHRFSEIVRYKPEQMDELLHSKENWLIHEFLTLVLDQFMDEIASEITKQEIMPTRVK